MKALRSLIFSLILLWSAPLCADNGIVLLLKDGKEIEFTFNDKPVIVCRENLEIETHTNVVSYNKNKVQRFYYSSNILPTNISTKQIGEDRISFRMLESGIEIKGLHIGEKVYVYTIDGKIINNKTASDSSSPLFLSIPSFLNTTFILKTNTGIHYKIHKK